MSVFFDKPQRTRSVWGFEAERGRQEGSIERPHWPGGVDGVDEVAPEPLTADDFLVLICFESPVSPSFAAQGRL